MKIGVGLPNGGDTVDGTSLLRLTQGAEEIGLDSVWVVDRWLRPHHAVTMPGLPVPVEMPVDYYRSVFDPIDLLAYLAGRTSRILLGTSAINVLYHPPVLLARRLATLDQLSGGRLIAGVTSGWMAEEFAVAGVPQTRMGGGFDDHVAAMRAVWGPDPVAYHGPHYTIPTSDIGPKPVQPGGIGLLVGYNTSAGLRRAARIGDGLHPYRNDLAQLRADLDQWRDAAAAAGRDPSRMPVVLRTAASLGPNHAAGSAEDRGRVVFAGEVASWPEDIAALESLGVDHVFLQFDPGTSADDILQAMAHLRVAARPG